MPAVVESMSPNSLPAMDSTTPSSTAASDKKRNKLGYHRTSVACADQIVHCRRRKIRCLVAADDAHGRCENCIRLRKECQFFPVDQQPPIEKKSRPNSRLESASTDPSTASSSPPIISGRPDQPPHQHQHQHPPHPQPEPFFTYQPIPLSASQDMSGLSSTASFAPENPMSPFAPDTIAPPEFAAPPSLDPAVPWDEFTTISDPHMLASMNAAKPPPMINLNPNVWNPDNPVPIPSNAPLQAPPTVPSQSQPQTLNTTPTPPTFAIQPDGSVWQVPPPPPPHQQAQPPQPHLAASYPPPPGQFGTSSPMDLDPKRRMTSPNTHSFPGTPGTPVNPQSPPPADPMQTMSMSMSYPGQPPHPAMGFPVWPDASGMAAMNVVPYPMFTGDATTTTTSTSQQGTPFGSPPPPMGHPGPGHSPHG